jgi:hypothetical protein
MRAVSFKGASAGSSVITVMTLPHSTQRLADLLIPQRPPRRYSPIAMPMPPPNEQPTLFSDYLMHFCGQNKSPRQALAVLESILRRREFVPSLCPLFYDPDKQLERRKLQAWATMVCFTDLRFQDLHHHVEKFGPYGIAIKKNSPPAGQCTPVHYIDVESDELRNSSRLSEGIRHLNNLQKRGKLDESWDFPARLKEFDQRRIAVFQDIRTRDENEWRFIANDERGDVLKFEPRDVRFLLVDTWDQAVRWNHRLDDPREEHLYPYGKAGVLAIPVELMIGRRHAKRT